MAEASISSPKGTPSIVSSTDMAEDDWDHDEGFEVYLIPQSGVSLSAHI
jgi:hypothetical protein